MTISYATYPKFKAWAPDGRPAAGYLLYTKLHGTLIHKRTFSDSGLTTENPEEIELDDEGEADLYLENGVYDFILKTPAGADYRTFGPIEGKPIDSENVLMLDTVADFINYRETDGTRAFVSGYHEKGDGKAIKEFWYDPDSTAIVNQATVFYGRDELAQGRWLAVLDGPANPYQFGFLNDGTTDCISIINATVTANLANGYRELPLPAGDYTIGSGIDLKTLLGVNDVDNFQGYFKIKGENANTTRIIPMADITGGMIHLIGVGSDARARELYFEGFTLYSDTRLNKSAEYGVYLRACAQVYFKDFNIINAVTKRGVYYNQTFVSNFDNCLFVGKSGGYADSGYGEPDAVDVAYNTPAVAVNDRLCAFFCENTATTIKFDTCRFRNYVNGLNIYGVDVMNLVNCAPESNSQYSLIVTGSSKNINLIGNYWEGSDKSIKINARMDSIVFNGNFFHDEQSIEFGAVEIYGAEIYGNYFYSGTDGIVDQGATFAELNCYGNFFGSLSGIEFSFAHTNTMAYGAGSKISFGPNKYVNDYYEKSSENLNTFQIIDYANTGGITVARTTDKFRVKQTYNLTGASNTEYIYKEIIGISSGLNDNLWNKYITVAIPFCANSYGGTGNCALVIDDGVVQREFTLGNITAGKWVNRLCYFRVSSAATKLQLRLYTRGDDIVVEDPVVLMGFHSDGVNLNKNTAQLYTFARAPGENPWRMYSSTYPEVLLISGDNSGSPSYGVWGVHNTTGVKSCEMNALTGIKTLVEGVGFGVKEGTNACMGVATLSAGAVTVNTNKVTANSRILLTIQSLGTVTVPKAIGVTARTASSSFTITSADATDTSVVAWEIIEPT